MSSFKEMKHGPGYFLGRPSLEIQIKEMWECGMSEPEIAKKLCVSSKYVHGALIILGLI